MSAERRLAYLKELLFLSTPSYGGSSDPMEAEEWLHRVKKRMDMIDVPIDLRITLAAYMLTGEADHWWDFVKRGMTWEDFERLFYNKYFERLLFKIL